MSNNSKKSRRILASKLGEQEVKMLQNAAKDDVLKVIYGSSEKAGDGFNQNVALSCPHVFVQKAGVGTGSQILSGLSDGSVEVKEKEVNIFGTKVKIKIYYHKCSVCGRKVPWMLGSGMDFKTAQESYADIYELAGMILETDMFIRAGFDGDGVRVPGFNPDGTPIKILTGDKLIKKLAKNPGARVARFELIKSLRNMSEASRIMSTGKLRSSRKVTIASGKVMAKKSGSYYDASSIRVSKKKGMSDTSGNLIEVGGEFRRQSTATSASQAGVKVED